MFALAIKHATRKDHVYHEIKAVQKWNKTWGFMRQKYKNVCTQELDYIAVINRIFASLVEYRGTKQTIRIPWAIQPY